MISSRGKPGWLKAELPHKKYNEVADTVKKLGLNTVCKESSCPNMGECWSSGTATFMIMGDTCTRGCNFCDVKTADEGTELDSLEHVKLAAAIKKMDLSYAVITSVDRDDLPDQGSGHFAKCISYLKEKCPGIKIEVLIPDFQGDEECLRTVIDAGPDVIAHNIETVEKLQSVVRDSRAGYKQSLNVLKKIKELNPKQITKSAIILGFGESPEELRKTFDDLRGVGVNILTMGQYLKPSDWHLDVKEYVTPDTFDYFQKKAMEHGFDYVVSGPFVRSSYKAEDAFKKANANMDK